MRRSHYRVTVENLWRPAWLAVTTVLTMQLTVSALPTGSLQATVAGRVVNPISGEGVAGARVTVTGFGVSGEAAGPSQIVETANDGRFQFSVRATVARIRLSASKLGWLQGNFGPLDHVIPTYDVESDLRSKEAIVRMWPTGTIEGSVVSASGEPVVGAAVDLHALVQTGLGPRWLRRPGLRGRTDEIGFYRIENLRPDTYVAVVRRPSAAPNEGAVFNPGTLVAPDARVLSIGPGDSVRADVVLPATDQRSKLLGRLVGGAGAYNDYTVELSAVGPDGLPISFSMVATKPSGNGRFVFEGLGPGRYRLSTFRFPSVDPSTIKVGGTFLTFLAPASLKGRNPLPPVSAEPTWVASALVDVPLSEKPLEVVLELRSGSRIRGRVLFDGSAPDPTALQATPVIVRPADGADLGMIPQSRIEADGTFATFGLPTGDYVLNVMSTLGLAGWTAVSIRVGTEEVLGGGISVGTFDVTGVELLLSSKTTTIRGTVRDAFGRPSRTSAVIVFPRDPRLRSHYLAAPAPQRVARLTLSAEGMFQAQLPPGEYLVAAASGYDPNWMTAGSLGKLVGAAIFVDLRNGDDKTVSLTIR